MIRYVFTFAAMAVALAACAHHQGFDHGAGAANCAEPNTHCVKVTVGTVDGRPRIRVDPERLRVRGQSHVIFWRLENATGQDYSFTDRGIFFETAEGRREFSCNRQQPTVFRCLDPAVTKGEFKYTVAVSGSVPPLDPWVINE